MKTLILIASSLLLTSCIAPRQSSFDPYATRPASQTYTPNQKTYHVERGQSYGSQGYDVTVTER